MQAGHQETPGSGASLGLAFVEITHEGETPSYRAYDADGTLLYELMSRGMEKALRRVPNLPYWNRPRVYEPRQLRAVEKVSARSGEHRPFGLIHGPCFVDGTRINTYQNILLTGQKNPRWNGVVTVRSEWEGTYWLEPVSQAGKVVLVTGGLSWKGSRWRLVGDQWAAVSP